MNYKQVSLKLEIDARTHIVDTVWIPTKFAVKGKTLDITINKELVKGWVVTEVYDGTISEEERNEQRKVQRKFAEVLDI